MGNTLVVDIIEEVAQMLLDNRENQVQRRWKNEFHLTSLHNGQQDIASKRPEAFPVVGAHFLSPGVRQQVPVGFNQLIDLRFNLDQDRIPISTIRHIERQKLDKMAPSWPAADPALEVVFFVFDPRYPKFFDVYPPQPDPAGAVEAVLGGRPPKPTLSPESTIGVEDQFASALKYFMIARARAIDGSGMTNWAKAKDVLELYYRELGMEKSAEDAAAPKPEKA